MYGMTHKSALPDVALYELYDRLKDAGRFHETFYDGEIEDSHHGFRDYARRPDIPFMGLEPRRRAFRHVLAHACLPRRDGPLRILPCCRTCTHW